MYHMSILLEIFWENNCTSHLLVFARERMRNAGLTRVFSINTKIFWCSHGTMRHYGSIFRHWYQVFFLKNIKLVLFVLIQLKNTASGIVFDKFKYNFTAKFKS